MSKRKCQANKVQVKRSTTHVKSGAVVCQNADQTLETCVSHALDMPLTCLRHAFGLRLVSTRPREGFQRQSDAYQRHVKGKSNAYGFALDLRLTKLSTCSLRVQCALLIGPRPRCGISRAHPERKVDSSSTRYKYTLDIRGRQIQFRFEAIHSV